jgi:hypothetical protein
MNFLSQSVTTRAVEMLLVQHDHVIEQVSSATPDPALGDHVLPRTAEGGAGGGQPSEDNVDSDAAVAILPGGYPVGLDPS